MLVPCASCRATTSAATVSPRLVEEASPAPTDAGAERRPDLRAIVVERCRATMGACHHDRSDPLCDVIPELSAGQLDAARRCLGSDGPIALCDPTMLCLQLEGVFPRAIAR